MKFVKFTLPVYLVVITIVIFKLTGQIYGVNDDVILQNLLSGLFTGKPEYMIRGSATPKISFGFALSTLYSAIPIINWFPISLLVLTLISWYLIGLICLRSKNLFAVIAFVFLSFLHLLWFIPSPTYTAASIILSFSSLLYISINIIDKKFTIFNPVLFILLSISYLIRPESFAMGFLVAFPCVIYAILRSELNYKFLLKKLYISFVLLFGIIFFDAGFEKIYYSQNNDWVTYSKWEVARYKIQANAPELAVSENPQKYGWTRAEVELFKSYYFVDKEAFSTSKLTTLVQQTSPQKMTLNKSLIEKAHQKIFDSDINWSWVNLISLISLFYLLFFMISIPSVKDYFLLSSASMITLYAIMFYVAGFLRQPERVQLSAIFLSNLVSLVSFSVASKTPTKFNLGKNPILGALILLLILKFSYAPITTFKEKVGKNTDDFWVEQTNYLENFPKDSIFIGNASQFRNNYVTPYLINHFAIEDRIFTLGWHNFSPHWDLRARQLGLDPDNILKNVINDSRVYLVSGEDIMPFLIEFMKEQNVGFSGPTKVGEMNNHGERYIVWKFGNDE